MYSVRTYSIYFKYYAVITPLLQCVLDVSIKLFPDTLSMSSDTLVIDTSTYRMSVLRV